MGVENSRGAVGGSGSSNGRPRPAGARRGVRVRPAVVAAAAAVLAAASRSALGQTATGILTYDPNGPGAPNFAVGTADFTDSGLGTDVAFANGNTVLFTQAGVTAGNSNIVVAAAGVSPAALNVSNATGTYNFTGGSIGGTGAVTMLGAGTLVLTSSDSYSGGTNISAGTVIASDSSLGTGAVTLSGGTLQAASAFTSAKAFTLSGAGGTFNTASYATTFTGNFNGSATTALNIIGSGSLTLTATASKDVVAAMNVGSGSTLTVQTTAARSYITVGSTTASNIAGTLVLGSSTALPMSFETGIAATFGGTGMIVVGPASSLQAYASVATVSANIGVLTDPTTGNTSVLGGNSSKYNNVLTVTGNIVNATTTAGGVSFGGTVGNGTSVNSSGGYLSGKVVLTGTNTYTGGTVITAGTVAANSSAGSLGTGAVLVTQYQQTPTTIVHGTLAGNGVVNAPVTIGVGGYISAGSGSTVNDSTGVLTTGAQIWNASAGGYDAKVNGTTAAADVLSMSGLTINATAAAPFTVILTNVSGGSTVLPAGTQYLLAVDTATQPGVFTAAINSTALNLSVGSFTNSNGGTLTLAEVDTPTAEDLLLVAAPEPTSLLLLTAAAAPLAAGRRQRRASCG